MKRILFAIAISIGFLILYLGTTAVIYFGAGQDDSLIEPLGTLVQFPSFLLSYFYPDVVSGKTPLPVTVAARTQKRSGSHTALFLAHIN